MADTPGGYIFYIIARLKLLLAHKLRNKFWFSFEQCTYRTSQQVLNTTDWDRHHHDLEICWLIQRHGPTLCMSDIDAWLGACVHKGCGQEDGIYINHNKCPSVSQAYELPYSFPETDSKLDTDLSISWSIIFRASAWCLWLRGVDALWCIIAAG